ncbi:MAG: tRNA preQ1(34) S-adenosylmethionine ribosyltransferase-isomerase QueA [Anaerolineales bacterium]
MRTSDFDYDLPEEYIAQRPIRPRDASRLLVLDRRTGEVEHRRFSELPDYLKSGDALVLNQTRVLPARLAAHKLDTKGKAEILLLQRQGPKRWLALVGGKGLSEGRRLQVKDGPTAIVERVLEGPRRILVFDEPISRQLEEIGSMPLPPYIHAPLQSPDEYQTTFAREIGSAAAPTAGLHFTPALLEDIEQLGVEIVRVTLHVGMDTFAPVREEEPRRHSIHREWCRVTPKAAARLNQVRSEGGRVFAVGTTSVRTLETSIRSKEAGVFSPFEGATDLYILPGFEIKAVDSLITNFHLPRSTLLMLVSAFDNRERILRIYELAKEKGYRFYSFGDAMLIL